MFDDDTKMSGYRSLQYLACYALWIGLSAVGFWMVWQLKYDIVALAIYLGLGRWTVAAVDKWGMLLVGILWLVGMILLEDYLRMGVNRGRLRIRAVRVFVFEAAALGIAYGARLLIT